MATHYVTEQLTGELAAAAGMPIPAEQLTAATELLDALFAMEAILAPLDLDGVEPELRWDARWTVTGGEGVEA
jgi:hypothetical protein